MDLRIGIDAKTFEMFSWTRYRVPTRESFVPSLFDWLYRARGSFVHQLPIPNCTGNEVGQTAIKMNELLKLAVEAHGSLARWSKVKAIKVASSITGGIWYVKNKGDFLKNVLLTVETQKQRLTVDFAGQDKRAIFQSNRIVIEKADGTLIEARDKSGKVV
jgi:hypothetical protein